MKKEELHQKLAQLETTCDYLTTELEYIDSLLRHVGFEQGLVSVKAVAEDIILRKVKL